MSSQRQAIAVAVPGAGLPALGYPLAALALTKERTRNLEHELAIGRQLWQDLDRDDATKRLP